MIDVEKLAMALARRRLERDRKIAVEAGVPYLLKLEPYLPQARRDAEVVREFERPDVQPLPPRS